MNILDVPGSVMRDASTKWNITICNCYGGFIAVMKDYISANWSDIEWDEDLDVIFPWGFKVFMTGMEVACPFPVDHGKTCRYVR